jgi:hypothetical protein
MRLLLCKSNNLNNSLDLHIDHHNPMDTRTTVKQLKKKKQISHLLVYGISVNNINDSWVYYVIIIICFVSLITGQLAYPAGLSNPNVVPFEHVPPTRGKSSSGLSRISHAKWQSLQLNESVHIIWSEVHICTEINT